MLRATVIDVGKNKHNAAHDDLLLPMGTALSERDRNLVYDKDDGTYRLAKIIELANSTEAENAERRALAAKDGDMFGAQQFDRLKKSIESCPAFEQDHRSFNFRNMDKDVTQTECIVQAGLVFERELGYN